MIGIQAMAHYIPEQRISNLTPDVLSQFDVNESFVREKIGVINRSIMDPTEDTSDIACHALEKLLETSGLDRELIEAVVVVTQNPDTNLPHVSAMVHGKIGLSETCAAFDLGLGCSGYVYGLSVLQSFMESNSLSHGVLITADPYSKIVDPHDKNTALLFGDAATATLIGPNPIFMLGPFTFGTRGQSSQSLVYRNGHLEMNGREVFNFAALVVPKNIHDLLQNAGLTLEQVDAVLLHQGSRYIVETIGVRLGAPVEKIRLGLEQIGNTISSSIPLLLEQEIERGEVHTIVLSGFGVGLSWASCLCQRRG